MLPSKLKNSLASALLKKDRRAQLLFAEEIRLARFKQKQQKLARTKNPSYSKNDGK